MSVWSATHYPRGNPLHHCHGNPHDTLGVAQGEATELFGCPSGRELIVKAGDVVLVPAGDGLRSHKSV